MPLRLAATEQNSPGGDVRSTRWRPEGLFACMSEKREPFTVHYSVAFFVINCTWLHLMSVESVEKECFTVSLSFVCVEL